MAIFTPITPSQVDTLLASFGLGPHIAFKGISTGTVNSNFHVTCQQGDYVLSILEATDFSTAQEIVDYAEFCYQHKILCPPLVKQKNGGSFATFEGKPVTLAGFLAGQSIINSNPEHCAQIGHTIALMHNLGQSYPTPIRNTMGKAWRSQTYKQLRPLLGKPDQAYLDGIMALQHSLSDLDLPKGLVHFDLFRDNVLFEQDKLTGILDFYYACYETFVFDLAITLNDWCAQWHQDQPSLDPSKTQALLQAYQKVRPLSSIEKLTLVDHCKLASAHFWLAREATRLQAKQGEGHFEKDPQEFKLLSLSLENQERLITSALG